MMEPWGDEAVSRVEEVSATIEEQGAIPRGDATMDDLAVGGYQIAQIGVQMEGGETLKGSGAGSGFYARSAYKKNMWRLAELVDGVDPEELELQKPDFAE